MREPSQLTLPRVLLVNDAGGNKSAVQIIQQFGAEIAGSDFAYLAGHADLPVFVNLKF